MSITANAPTFSASPLDNYQIVQAQYQNTESTRIYPSLWRITYSYKNNKKLSSKRIRNWSGTTGTSQKTVKYNDYHGKKKGETDGTYCVYQLVIYADNARKKKLKSSSVSSPLYSAPAAPAPGDLSAAITTNTLTAKWKNPNMGSNASKQDALATVILYESDGTQADTYTASVYTELSHQFTGLTSAADYYFTIQYKIAGTGDSSIVRSKTYTTTPEAPLQPTNIRCGIVGGGRQLPASGTGSVYCAWDYNSADGSPQTAAAGSTQAGSWSVADDTTYLTFNVSTNGTVDPSYCTARVDGTGWDFTFTLTSVTSSGGTTSVGTTITLFIPNTLSATDLTAGTATSLPLTFAVQTAFYDFLLLDVALSLDGEEVLRTLPEAVTHYAESGSTRSYKLEIGADTFLPQNLATYDYTLNVTTPYGTTDSVTGTIAMSFAQPDAPTITVTDPGDYSAQVEVDIADAFSRSITADGDGTDPITVTLPADAVGRALKEVCIFGNNTGAEDMTVTHDGSTYTLPSCLLFFYNAGAMDRLIADSSDVKMYQMYYHADSSEKYSSNLSGGTATIVWRISGSGWNKTYTGSDALTSSNYATLDFMLHGMDWSLVKSGTYMSIANHRYATYSEIEMTFTAKTGATPTEISNLASALVVAVRMSEILETTLGSSTLPALVADETFEIAASSTEQPTVAYVTYTGNQGVSGASVYRIVGDSRELVAANVQDNETVFDYTPPLNTEVSYIGVTLANGVPSNDSDPVSITIPGNSILINYGEQNQLVCEGEYDPAYSGTWDYDTAEIKYAGDEYPTGYDSGQRSMSTQVSFTIADDEDDETLRDMPDRGAEVIYRDPTGQRFTANMGSITEGYDSGKPNRWSASVKLTRIEG